MPPLVRERRARWISSALLSLFLLAAPCYAQVRGTISGYVQDASGAGIPGASVAIINTDTSSRREVSSNGEGFYQALGLIAGTYTIEAKADGFKQLENLGVTLRSDQNLRSDLVLEVGAVSESIEVSASAAAVDTRASNLATTISDKRIVDLPLNGRNVVALASLLPGVTQVSAPSNSDVTNARGGPTMTVNGGRANQSYYSLNGTFFSNPSRNTGLNVPPPDAVQEFRIQTSNYSAADGRNSGAIVSVITKAGTNEVHGALWEFHRNSALNARNFFQAEKPSERRNQFGGSMGGPISKDNVFVFGAYEGILDRRAASVVNAFPPTAAERNGDFSSVSTQLVDPLNGNPFVNNQIPAGRFDPVAKNLLGFVPDAPTGGRLSAVAAAPRDSHLAMMRSDWNISSRQTLFGHYYLNQNKVDAASLQYGSNIPGWMGRQQQVRNQNAGLNHTFIASPTLLNQITLGFTRSVSSDLPSDTRSNASLGLPGFPDYTDGGATQFRISGRFDLRSGGPVKFLSNNYDLNEALSWTKGRHNLKFGAQYLDLSFFQSFLGPPTFSFNGTRSGNALADFVLGSYRTLSLPFGVRVNDGLSSFFAGYVQDDFKISPRLTLNLGLRYEVMQPWVDKGDRVNTVDVTPGAQSSVVPNAPPNLLFVGDLPRGLYKTDKNNFGPRIGFAWDVLGDGRTAVRGAYGIFYETMNADSVAQENPPFAGSTQYVNGVLSDPGAGHTLPPVVPGADNFEFIYPLNNFFMDLGIRSPYVQQWNLTVERELPGDVVLQGSYVGKVGHKLQAYRPFNVAVFEPGVDANGNPLSTLENAGERAPFNPGIYGNQMIALSSAFNQSYHSAQFRLDKRFSRNFSALASYTYGKSIDDSSTTNLGGCVSNPYDLRSDRGRADFDARHAGSLTWNWTPVASSGNVFKRVFGGWSLSGIHQFRTGYPLTFYNGDDIALGADICGGGEQHPNQVGTIERDHQSRADMVNAFFDANGLDFPAQGQYGSAGRNILTGPAFASTDFALLKDFTVWNESRLQLRAEFFNAFNQVNFSDVRTTLTDSNVGQISGARDGRAIQLGLKYIW